MNKKNYRALFFSLCVMLSICCSCREDVDDVPLYRQSDGDISDFVMSNNSFAEQFKAIWTILDCNYLIWDYEAKFGVDWNEIYAKYLPVFKEIDAAYAIDERNKISTDSLKRIYEEFLLPLHDGHLNITIDIFF